MKISHKVQNAGKHDFLHHSHDKMDQALSLNFQWTSECKGHTYCTHVNIRKGKENGNEVKEVTRKNDSNSGLVHFCMEAFAFNNYINFSVLQCTIMQVITTYVHHGAGADEFGNFAWK